MTKMAYSKRWIVRVEAKGATGKGTEGREPSCQWLCTAAMARFLTSEETAAKLELIPQTSDSKNLKCRIGKHHVMTLMTHTWTISGPNLPQDFALKRSK